MVTRVVLSVTLVSTLLAAADVVRRDELTPRTTALYLLFFTLLFLVRVAGQVFVALRAPAWLPPMGEWNLVPYRLLLPVQLAFAIVMTAIAAGIANGDDPVAGRHHSFGVFLLVLSAVYAGSMAVRYAVRVHRRPQERWFGGAIPIVFHVVLAAFVLTWGAFNVQR